jgi:hypothetical protein
MTGPFLELGYNIQWKRFIMGTSLQAGLGWGSLNVNNGTVSDLFFDLDPSKPQFLPSATIYFGFAF